MTWTERFQKIDVRILLLVTFISSIGFLTLYSAAGGSLSPWASKQIIRFTAGTGLLVLIACVDIRFWLRQSYLIYVICLFLLIAVELMGRIGMGAQRWIDLYVFHLQPSELMKLALLMALARYFHDLTYEEVGKIRRLLFPITLLSLPSLLVLRQPDLGTALVLIFSSAAVFYVSGLRLWMILTFLGAALAAFPILWHVLHDYQKKRILTFLNPESDPLGSGYHILQSKITIGSGGWFGKGFLGSTQGALQFLPERHTDFIFAFFCEEFGIVGGAFLLFLYGILIAYGYRISLQSRSAYGRFLGIGLTTLFFLYVFINTAMVMGLLPVVGVPLALLSYGGTAMLTVLMGLGLLLSIAIHRHVRIGRAGGLL